MNLYPEFIWVSEAGLIIPYNVFARVLIPWDVIVEVKPKRWYQNYYEGTLVLAKQVTPFHFIPDERYPGFWITMHVRNRGELLDEIKRRAPNLHRFDP